MSCLKILVNLLQLWNILAKMYKSTSSVTEKPHASVSDDWNREQWASRENRKVATMLDSRVQWRVSHTWLHNDTRSDMKGNTGDSRTTPKAEDKKQGWKKKKHHQTRYTVKVKGGIVLYTSQFFKDYYAFSNLPAGAPSEIPHSHRAKLPCKLHTERKSKAGTPTSL